MNRSFALRRVVLAGLLLASTLPGLDAQEEAPVPKRTPRKILFPFIGAAAAAAAAGFYFSSNGLDGAGSCNKPVCVLAYSVSGGALIGYLVGREVDQSFNLRYRGGAPLFPSSDFLTLDGEPVALALAKGRAVTAGLGGAQLVETSGSMRFGPRRATGLRGISVVELAGSDGSLAVGSATGLYLYPPSGTTGTLSAMGAVQDVITMGARRFVAVGNRLSWLPIAPDSAEQWPGLTLSGEIRALAGDEDHGLVWAATDSSLVTLRLVPDSLMEIAHTPLPPGARRISRDGDRLAVALGEEGARLFELRGEELIARGDWRGARFVYDVAFARNRMYLAAGIDGVYVADVTGARISTLGLARELGFAVALGSRDGYVYLIDRSTNALRRFRSDFPLR